MSAAEDSITKVVELVRIMFGEDAAKAFEALIRLGGEAGDDEIAREAGLKINTVRRLLYALSGQGFVSYRRVRERGGGWYVYKWHVDRTMLESTLLLRKKATLEKLKQRLEYEENNTFFVCPSDGSRYTFDEALENEFRCPRCGESLEDLDNTLICEILKHRISIIEEELRREQARSS